jgi:hypothetical protein
MSEDAVNATITGSVTGLVSAMAEGAASVKSATASMSESFAGVRETVHGALLPLTALLALLEGGELFKEAISQTAELAVQLEILSQKTGESVEHLSALQYAADLSHVSAETLEVGLQKLAKGMEAAAKGTGPVHDALKLLGLHATDASGRLLPLNTMLLQIAEQFAGMEDGAGKTAIAMDLFGRSGANLIPLLNKGSEGIAALEAEARRLGSTFDEDGVRTALAYEDAMKKVHAVVGATERRMAVELMPTLTQLAEAFTDSAHSGNLLTTFAAGVAETLRFLAVAANDAALAIKAVKNAVMSLVDANAALKQMKEDYASWLETNEKLMKPKTGLEEDPALAALLGGTKRPAPAPGKELSHLEQLQAEWLQIREANKDHFGALAGLELAFWKDKIRTVDASSKEHLEIEKRIATLDDQVAKQGYEGQIEALRAKEAADADDKAQVVRDRLEELALIRAHYSEASKEVQEGIKRVSEAQHALAKETEKEWKTAFDAIPTAFSHAVSSMAKQTDDMRALFREMFRDLVVMSLDASAATLRDHVATELAKKHVSAASITQRIALETWAAVTSVALATWSTLSNITKYAVQAAAAAWASIAAIPIIGPFLAPAAAIASLVGVLALGSSIKSAHDGYDVPAGVNPLTQLHAQEMVLPAELANQVRNSVGGSGGGGDTYHIHAMDSRSFTEFAERNYAAFGSAVKKAAKYGAV